MASRGDISSAIGGYPLVTGASCKGPLAAASSSCVTARTTLSMAGGVGSCARCRSSRSHLARSAVIRTPSNHRSMNWLTQPMQLWRPLRALAVAEWAMIFL
jgi:hypothetical protein